MARGLPSAGHDLHSTPGRRFKWPDSVALWSFIEGVALDGLFIFGLSIQAQKILGGDAVLIAGGLMALRYVSEMLLSPLGGRAAQRFGATSMLLLFSFLSALALSAFGSYWVIVGAAAVLVLRALQLPLVTTLVAERNPGSMRVSALASNAVWRDIGAGLGPLLAGLLLPVASAPLVFGVAGAAIAVSALFCWRGQMTQVFLKPSSHAGSKRVCSVSIPSALHLGLMCIHFADQLRLGAGVGVQGMHLRQPQVVETQHFHGRRVIGLHVFGDLVHHIGHAHQVALELPAIHRRRQPGLGPERATHQGDGDQHPGEHTADIEAKVIAAGFAEQHHRQARQQHGQGQEQHGHDQRAAAGLLAVGERGRRV